MNLRLGTCDLLLGTYYLELITWNLLLGTYYLELGTGNRAFKLTLISTSLSRIFYT